MTHITATASSHYYVPFNADIDDECSLGACHLLDEDGMETYMDELEEDSDY